MRQNALNVTLFVLLASAVLGGWYYVDQTFFPPPEPKPPRETVLALTGGVATATSPANTWPRTSRPELTKVEPKADDPAKPAPVVAAPAEPPTFVVLGSDNLKESFKRVVLTTRGAAVQQVVLNAFEEANRLGTEVRRPDGTPQPMHVIPGIQRQRYPGVLTSVHNVPLLDMVPDLAAGPLTDPALSTRLSEPSYLLLHYPSRDDPARQPDDATQMNDGHPSPELGDRTWTLVESGRADGGDWKATFETDLGAPYFLKLRKTYTLGPKDYHVGLKFDVEPLPGREKGKGVFRYQLVGARGVPIEGEWYTYAFRNVMAGWVAPNGAEKRSFEDAREIQSKFGGEKVVQGSNTFAYAAVATQYFASAIAIDDTVPPEQRKRMWDYVRPTREPTPGDDPAQAFLSDVTVRAAAAPLDPAEGEPTTHKYLIYNGPVKVGLLRQMPGDAAVSDELVARYTDRLTLRTMTDYHSPNVFGRFANAIWWSDLVIFFTNLMHSVLGFLHRLAPVWGLNIIMLTVMVRLMLFAPSRRQQAAMAKMQAQMAALKPEIDKLHEKYKDDYHGFNQARTALMMQHGVNPLSTMGGCALLFAQMPILMGLYFCLQESVFFRLQSFLWVPNLAAPDMLAWWSEKIPVVSTPDSIGGTLYLGPFFNILPLVSVVLIFIHQKLTMPPPTDEQQEMQQKMMKFMVIMMAVFFYKVPAGLCLYFICGTLWALGERKFIPKPMVNLPPGSLPGKGGTDTGSGGGGGGNKPAPPSPNGGGFLSRMRDRVEELQRQAEEQSKRQIRNAPPTRSTPPPERRDRKKRRK